MIIHTRTFWLPKRGNSDSEYEDAAWPLEPGQFELDNNNQSFRFAVADGATEASFSDIWARLLVEGYASKKCLDSIAEEWSESVKNLDLPWYAAEKAEKGAFAALVGLEIIAPVADTNACTWEASAVGDSCLMLTRDMEIIESFPLNSYECFDNSPALLSSKPENGSPNSQTSMFSTKSGSFRSGDCFLLISDALAAWIFAELESGEKNTFRKLFDIESNEQLKTLVDQERERIRPNSLPAMRNDDVTLLIIETA